MRRVVGALFTGWCLVYWIYRLILPRRIACFSVHVIWHSLVCMYDYFSVYLPLFLSFHL